jgi:glutamine amidotransferase
MIDVIDYEAGNAPSVINALGKLGVSCRAVSSPKQLASSTCIILPGVGSARATLDSLEQLGCLDVLQRKVLGQRVPFLGICIGLQILFDHSEEGDVKCLGWLRGRVKLFPAGKVRVPQMGWNEVKFDSSRAVCHGLPERAHFYFVNSYYAVPDDPAIVVGTTDYGLPFCSMLAVDNIVATQFHIEKSGPAGLKLLFNFTSMRGGQ